MLLLGDRSKFLKGGALFVKRPNKLIKSHETGFTLIELLIVIVIIGILAAVMLVVINPTRIQNRAKNATIKSTLNKLGFALSGARAATGQLPNNSKVLFEFENTTAVACVGNTTLNCQFTYSSVQLPSTCSTNYYSGDGTSGCRWWAYSMGTGYGQLDVGIFRFVAKKYRLSANEPSEVYVFDSIIGLVSCPSTITQAQLTTTPLPATCVTTE